MNSHACKDQERGSYSKSTKYGEMKRYSLGAERIFNSVPGKGPSGVGATTQISDLRSPPTSSPIRGKRKRKKTL